MDQNGIGKWLATGFVVLVAVTAAGSYNGHVGRFATVKAASSEIGNQYKRQAELVPNLVATVEKAAGVEKSILTGLAEARAAAAKVNIDLGRIAADPEAMRQFLASAQSMQGALTRFVATAEAYPQLQSIAGFRELQTQLEGSQNRITVARTRYISAVRDYNAGIGYFPGFITASLAGFRQWPEFAATADEQKTPAVNFKN